MYHSRRGARLYYETVGEGTPVVFLHGYPVDHRCMAGCMEPFFSRREGYRRIYLDLPGMGLSETSPDIRNADDMIEAVHALLEEIIPGETYLLAGYSYGGYLARGMVYKYADEIGGLFLLCPVSLPDRRERELPPHRVFSRDEAFLAGLEQQEAADFGGSMVFLNRPLYERYRGEIGEALALGDRDFIRRYVREGYGFSFPVDRGICFDKPSLILAGRQDGVVGYRDLWPFLENYPRATFAVLDRAGHNLQMEQERLFALFLGDWLDRVDLG